MADITVIRATFEDAKSIKLVQRDTWLYTYPNEKLGITLEHIKKRVSKTGSKDSVRKFQEALALKNQRSWVAKENSKTIGFCTAEKNPDTNQLKAIYVLPEYHGKEAGKMLIEHALEWLGNDKDIIVEVASYNDRAIHFYEKYGFVKNGMTGDSKGIPTIFLTKQKIL